MVVAEADVALRPICLVGLGDELRPEAAVVLEKLSAQGIGFKVLSGDNSETVQATVRHLQLPWTHEAAVTGDQLAHAADRETLILERNIFGRVSPDQKLGIIETLQRHGKHVAMIGDGVNDVLPIKRADLGIAMGDGSQASKNRASGCVRPAQTTTNAPTVHHKTAGRSGPPNSATSAPVSTA